MQNKLPLINSAHGSETRNIINELIKLFNGMGYTYNESLQKAQDILDEAQQTNDMNESVQQQINTLIAESGTSDAEVLQARVDAEGNEYAILKERLDEKDQNFSAQLAQTQEEKISHGEVSALDIDKNRGKFDQTYMTDEFLEQITGDAPVSSVPRVNSVTTDKLAYGAVTTNKMAHTHKSKNLFDSPLERGTIVNSTGEKGVLDSFMRSSNFIAVKANTTYTISDDQGYDYRIFEYTSSGDFNQSTTSHTFTTGATTQLVKAATYSSETDNNLNTKIMLNEGATAKLYEQPWNRIPLQLLDKELNMIVGNMEKSNNINTSEIEPGTIISTGLNGSITDYYIRSKDFIDVVPNTTYSISDDKGYPYRVFYYDNDYSFILRTEGGEKTFTTDGSTRKIKVATYNSTADSDLNTKIMINTGTENLPYEAPGKLFPVDMVSGLVGGQTESSLAGLTWNALGDSNTAPNYHAEKKYPQIIADRTGVIANNYGMGARGYIGRNHITRGDWVPGLYTYIDSWTINADIITILAGGNDVYPVDNGDTPLGQFGDTEPDTSFYGTVDHTYSLLVNKYPTKKIGVITQFKRGEGKDETISQMVKAVKEVAGKYGLPVLDMYHHGNIHAYNEDYRNACMLDGVHLNDLGSQLVADKIQVFLESI